MSELSKMKQLTRFPIFLVIMLAMLPCVGCKRLGGCKDGEFTFSRVDYSGTNLRLDGYYYSKDGIPDSERYVNLYFLFRNGVVQNYFGYNEDSVKNGSISKIPSVNQSTKFGLGIFKVTGDFINMQYWLSAPFGGCDYVFRQTGNIINDTTFVITETKSLDDNGSQRTVNSIYKFRSFLPKPDSTNSFIK